jgi:hypothetical protein
MYYIESRVTGISYLRQKSKANWIGHLLHRNFCLKHIIEGKREGGIEEMRKQGRRRKQLLHELKETNGDLNLKEESLDCSVWRTYLGSGCGPVVNRLGNERITRERRSTLDF